MQKKWVLACWKCYPQNICSQIIYLISNLALNKLQGLMCHKIQLNKQPINLLVWVLYSHTQQMGRCFSSSCVDLTAGVKMIAYPLLKYFSKSVQIKNHIYIIIIIIIIKSHWLILFRHPSQSLIAPGKFSRLHPVSAKSWC